MRSRSVVPGLVAAALMTMSVPTAASAAEVQSAWYVSADASPGGDGSPGRPFDSLAAAESASSAGDTITILPAVKALDGGIALKEGQRLLGAGADVQTLAPEEAAPELTNSSNAGHNGDIVVLADNARVENLRLADAHRGAVYGLNVTGVSVIGNDVSGQNASCTPGFLIPEFNAPTNLPGVGIPIHGGLQNGWAGIMIDADTRRGGTATIADNLVRDAECGDGIDVRVWGTSQYDVSVNGNDVRGLRQGSGMKSVLALGLQARDSARLHAKLDRNTQSALGNDDDLNLIAAGADSEGVFVNGVGPSTMKVELSRNTYTNEKGIGGFSANGLEMVTMGAGSRVEMRVTDSSFSGSPGDVIEEGALGTDAVLDLELDRVRAERSTGTGNTVVLPFNNGDCLLAGSLGARNTIRLKVRDSVLRECSSNGLSLGSNVVNGSGPTTEISADIRRTSITGNRGGNVGIRNFTALEKLSVRIEDSDLRLNKGVGSSVASFGAERLARAGSSDIDLGGGTLGSAGRNCTIGSPLAADVVGYKVSAKGNWWGRPSGPNLLETLVLLGSLDKSQPLAVAPAACD